MGDAYAELGFVLDIDLRGFGDDPALVLFAEDHGRVVVTVDPEHLSAFRECATAHHVAVTPVGTVDALGGELRIKVGEVTVRAPIGELREIYANAIPRRMAPRAD
jgi:phosphoribosylformylglycinamidine (FGAM) synthase-like enzyme